MFSRILKRHQGMAFSTDVHGFAQREAKAYAIRMLTEYREGRERAYSLEDVRRELKELWGVEFEVPNFENDLERITHTDNIIEIIRKL